jgi:hypothetical protein
MKVLNISLTDILEQRKLFKEEQNIKKRNKILRKRSETIKKILNGRE